MIERFGKAIGLRIPLWSNRQLECWFVPRGTKIPRHYHSKTNSFICYLLGTMRVEVDGVSRTICGFLRKRESTGRWILATRYIPAGQPHSAEVLGRFALFLNFEKCHSARQSASKDFVLLP